MQMVFFVELDWIP